MQHKEVHIARLAIKLAEKHYGKFRHAVFVHKPEIRNLTYELRPGSAEPFSQFGLASLLESGRRKVMTSLYAYRAALRGRLHCRTAPDPIRQRNASLVAAGKDPEPWNAVEHNAGLASFARQLLAAPGLREAMIGLLELGHADLTDEPAPVAETP